MLLREEKPEREMENLTSSLMGTRRSTRSRMCLTNQEKNNAFDAKQSPMRSKASKTAMKSSGGGSMLMEVSATTPANNANANNNNNSGKKISKHLLCGSPAPTHMLNLNQLMMQRPTTSNQVNFAAVKNSSFKAPRRKSRFCITTNRDMRRLRNRLASKRAQVQASSSLQFGAATDLNRSFQLPRNGKKLEATKSRMINIVQLAKDTNAALRKATLSTQHGSQHILAVTQPIMNRRDTGLLEAAEKGSRRVASKRQATVMMARPNNNSVYEAFSRASEPAAPLMAPKKSTRKTRAVSSHLCTTTKANNKHEEKRTMAAGTSVALTNQDYARALKNSCRGGNERTRGGRQQMVGEGLPLLNAVQNKVYADNAPMTRSRYRRLFAGDMAPPPVFPIEQLRYMQ